MLLLGFGGILFNVTVISLIQAITPDRILGRANASRRFVVWGVIPFGGLVGGALGSSIGLRETMVIGALGGAARSRADPALARPLGREDVRARGSVLADRLREQRARVALPGEVRLRTAAAPARRSPPANPFRGGREPGERVLELVACIRLVEVLRHSRDRAPVELELAARVAPGREQQLGAAYGCLHLVRVELDVLPGEPGEAGQQIVARPRLEELQQLTHASQSRDVGQVLQGGPLSGVSNSGPAPSGSTTTAPFEAKNCAI